MFEPTLVERPFHIRPGFPLCAMLWRKLAKQPGIAVCDLGVERCGIVNYLKDGDVPSQTRERLAAINVNVRVSRSPRAPAPDLPRPRIGRARPRRRALPQRRIRGGALRSCSD